MTNGLVITPGIEQPTIKQGYQVGRATYMRGAPKSVRRLAVLKFDPIGELVAKYHKLGEQIARQEKIQSGALVELYPPEHKMAGKARAFRMEDYIALMDKQVDIAKELLRYGYGRVPEAVTVKTETPQPLIVNLTKKGDVYVANQADDEFPGDEGMGDGTDDGLSLGEIIDLREREGQ